VSCSEAWVRNGNDMPAAMAPFLALHTAPWWRLCAMREAAAMTDEDDDEAEADGEDDGDDGMHGAAAGGGGGSGGGNKGSGGGGSAKRRRPSVEAADVSMGTSTSTSTALHSSHAHAHPHAISSASGHPKPPAAPAGAGAGTFSHATDRGPVSFDEGAPWVGELRAQLAEWLGDSLTILKSLVRQRLHRMVEAVEAAQAQVPQRVEFAPPSFDGAAPGAAAASASASASASAAAAAAGAPIVRGPSLKALRPYEFEMLFNMDVHERVRDHHEVHVIYYKSTQHTDRWSF
jgi:hypothetical protein